MPDAMPKDNPLERADQRVLAGWLVDGRGHAIRRNVLLQIAGGRIVRMDTLHGNHPLPKGLRDFSHATIIPPLIDAHVHLALSGTRDPQKRERQLIPAYEAACTTIAAHLAMHARHGILAVRDGGDRHGYVLRCMKAPTGSNLPRVHVSSTCWAWHARGRYGRMIGRSPDAGTGLGESVANACRGTDHVKLIHSGINSLEHFGRSGAPQFEAAALRETVAWAHRNGMPVMVHANGPQAVAQAIEAGCDSIEHGYFMGADNLHRLAETRIAWVPTLIPMAALADDPSLSAHQQDTARRTLDHQLAQVRQAHQLGVKVVLGTDAGSVGVDHGLAVAREIALLQETGLTVAAVVQAASGLAARLLGLKDGHRLAPGCAASFIVVPGAPHQLSENLKNIDALCVNGVWS